MNPMSIYQQNKDLIELKAFKPESNTRFDVVIGANTTDPTLIQEKLQALSFI